MTLVSSIITDAYRESNLIAISASPTTAENTEALRLLNRVVYSVFGDEMGESLIDVPIGRNNISKPASFPGYDTVPDTDWVVPGNSRLLLNLSAAQTVYLDPAPQDGSRFAIQDVSGNLATYNLTINGNGRMVAGATTAVLSTNSLSREYFYRADLGDWKVISTLVAGDTFPFPEKFDDMFIVGLAMRLNPRHAVQADPQSVEAYRRGLRQFRSKYRQTRQVSSDPALTRLTLGERFFDGDFDSGRPY